MKKSLKLFLMLFIVLSFGLFSCNKELSEEEINKQVTKDFEKLDKKELIIKRETPKGESINTLSLLTVNDFHGALEEDDGKYGIAKLGDYLINRFNNEPDSTIIISAGDMFQGSAISNYRHGRDVIKMMNAIGFELMTIGNHEFDWSLDEILKYRDGDLSNGEANFPFLGANIINIKTNKIPNGIEPYTILNKGDLKVGVIGFIGHGLEDDIATGMVADYQFLEPVEIVRSYAKELRTQKSCDVVIAVGHDDNTSTNNGIAALAGDERVDAIVNGHSHLDKKGTISGDNGRLVPYVQAGTAGKYIGEITLRIENKIAVFEDVKNNRMDDFLGKNDILKEYLDKIIDITSPIFERVLVTTSSNINRFGCADWAVNALQAYFDVDVAFINYGGIRANAFPIKKDEKVKVSKVYQIMPFDNTIKLVKLTGQQIINVTKSTEINYSDTLDLKGRNWINGKDLVLTDLYSVAAVDYIFDKPEYPFTSGENIEQTGILFRDVLIDTLEKLGSQNKKWKI